MACVYDVICALQDNKLRFVNILGKQETFASFEATLQEKRLQPDYYMAGGTPDNCHRV